MWGGRLKVSRARREPARASKAGVDLRLLLAAGLVASAVIHVAVVPEHLAEWPAAGVFFILITAAEAGVAALLFTRVRQQVVLLAAVALSIGPLLVWLYRMWPGRSDQEPGMPEAIGLPDIAACTLEVATLLAAVVLLRAASHATPGYVSKCQGARPRRPSSPSRQSGSREPRHRSAFSETRRCGDGCVQVGPA